MGFHVSSVHCLVLCCCFLVDFCGVYDTRRWVFMFHFVLLLCVVLYCSFLWSGETRECVFMFHRVLCCFVILAECMSPAGVFSCII